MLGLTRADFVQKEFEKIMDKREVVPKLNELEDLVSEAVRRREADPNSQPTPYVNPPFPLPSALTPLPRLYSNTLLKK